MRAKFSIYSASQGIHCIKIRAIAPSALSNPRPGVQTPRHIQTVNCGLPSHSREHIKISVQVSQSRSSRSTSALNVQTPSIRAILCLTTSDFGCLHNLSSLTKQQIFNSMAMETTPRARRGYVAVLLLGVCLTTFCHSATAQCSAAESAALLKFKSVVLDPRGDLATWTGGGVNCCSWRGIECSSSGVSAIKLYLKAPIRGQTVTIDPNNPSASTIAGAALAELTQLVALHTDWVAWRGPLPVPQLSKLPLRELVIRNGGLGNRSPPDSVGGALQNDIGNLAGTLEILTLAGTNYNSGLPSALCRLAKLRVLEVSGSLMSNVGPSCLNNITGLQEVRMMWNRKVTGGLPVWPTSMKSLKVLDFSNNAHSGNVPVQYGKLGGVELHLGGNHLAGRVPAGLSSKPAETFRPGNEKLCGAPLPSCPV